MTSEKLKVLASIKSTALVEILQQVAGLGASASALYWSEQNDDIHLANMDERLDKIEVALIEIRQNLQVVRGQPGAPTMRVGEGLAKVMPRSDGHPWQGQRSDGSLIGPYNEQATLPPRLYMGTIDPGYET